MTPILLRLLLCLCLVVDTTAGAWAAGGMAAPAPVSRAACHDPAMAAMAPSGGHAGPSAPHHAAGQKHDACCKTASCDCLQHCSAALALPASVRLPATRGSQPSWTLHDRHGEPAPYRPVRPPIA